MVTGVALTEMEFSAMARRHRHELTKHCSRVLGSSLYAEDAVQDALLRAWRNRGSLERRERVRPWLYKIATNTAIDARRRNAFRLASECDTVPDDVVASDAETYAMVAGRETLELTLVATMRLLTPRQRAVLLLRDLLGLSIEEIADLLETRVPAVNAALQRARRRMRSERRETWSARAADRTERERIARFVDAYERGDTSAAIGLVGAGIEPRRR